MTLRSTEFLTHGAAAVNFCSVPAMNVQVIGPHELTADAPSRHGAPWMSP
ncbi:hypothetical protein K7B06_03080 [Streptomyces erythrochromogenes]|nr:hypothetical protein [Streptomyces erythrochromogenes]